MSGLDALYIIMSARSIVPKSVNWVSEQSSDEMMILFYYGTTSVLLLLSLFIIQRQIIDGHSY